MTNTPDQLDLEGGKAKSLGEKFFDVLVPFGHTWANFPDDLKVSYERHALAFAASLSHDETATAVIADLEARLRASEAECERLQADNDIVHGELRSVRALATSQAETIGVLVAALMPLVEMADAMDDAEDVISVDGADGHVRLVFDGMTMGEWSRDEFRRAQAVYAALSRTPSGEARPDAGADGGEGV